MKAANTFLPGGRKPYEFKYFMFNKSQAFKLLAQLVLQVAEVKLRWHCQKAAAERAKASVPEQADEIQHMQAATPAEVRPLNGHDTTKSKKARKNDFYNFR